MMKSEMDEFQIFRCKFFKAMSMVMVCLAGMCSYSDAIAALDKIEKERMAYERTHEDLVGALEDMRRHGAQLRARLEFLKNQIN